MNLRNILANLWLILCFAFSIVEGHLSEHEQVVCKFVANLGDNQPEDAKFSIVVDSISMNDSLTNAPDISIFMFARRDLKKFETNFDMHFYRRWTNMWMHGDQDSPLNVTVKPEYANDNVNYYLGTLETSKPYKDISEGKVMATLDVADSGEYCAVISLPRGLERLRAREVVTHSYGLLPYEVHLALKSTFIYCIILTMLTALMMATFYKYAKPNVNDRYNSSNVSLLFKSFLWFVYLPNYISTIMRYGYTIYIRNSKKEYEGVLLFKILNWVDANIQITNRYIVFLLAVGYGTIYTGLGFGYVPPSSSPTSIHTPMPARKWNRGVLLYGLNIVSFSLLKLIKNYGQFMHVVFDYFEGYVDDNHVSAYYFITPVIDFLSVSFPLLWMSMSFMYYVRNFSILDKTSNGGLNSNQYLVKQRKSYQASIALILLIPLIFGSIYLGTIIKEVDSSGRNFNRHFTRVTRMPQFIDEGDDPIKKSYILLKLWINYFTVLSSMLFTYFYWMKNNVGIKLQSRLGSGEYYEIPMSEIN